MLLHLVGLTAPLFLLVLLGYALSRFGWPRSASPFSGYGPPGDLGIV